MKVQPLDLARLRVQQAWSAGRMNVAHRWKHASVLARAYRCDVPVTVHPGIGYDIIANHPIFNGAVLGRAAEWDFKLFGGSVEGLDGGVVLSVGSAIMGPQVVPAMRQRGIRPPSLSRIGQDMNDERFAVDPFRIA